MVYLLETLPWSPDPMGNDAIWRVLTDKKLAPRGGGFAHIWLQTMLNPPPWPKGGGGGFNWLVLFIKKKIKRILIKHYILKRFPHVQTLANGCYT